MRQMEEARKKTTVNKFKQSCINVIDQSIMEWYNKFDPGFMCAGRKPYRFGNERHNICCGITLILWMAKITEGRDILAQLGPKLHSEIVRTIGIMLQMCESIFNMGKYL